jgi:spore coat polysaccharide biosynthesis protein SpsF
MNIVAIIQARIGSTRLPGKVMLKIKGKPLIWHVCNRLSNSKKINQIVLAATTCAADDILQNWCIENGIEYFRGSEDDVLDRFYQAAIKYNADVIVRVTADDPFKDPQIIDRTIELLVENGIDFSHNNYPVSFPEGMDVEVFTFNALEAAAINATLPFDREHVTQYFYKNPTEFKSINLSNNENRSYLRWTIDTEADFKMAETIYDKLYREDSLFNFEDIIHLIDRNPEIALININEIRSEHYKTIKNE